jgi:hypothetical protein
MLGWTACCGVLHMACVQSACRISYMHACSSALGRQRAACACSSAWPVLQAYCTMLPGSPSLLTWPHDMLSAGRHLVHKRPFK